MGELVYQVVLARWVPIQIVGLCASSAVDHCSRPRFPTLQPTSHRSWTAAFHRHHHLTLPRFSLDTLSQKLSYHDREKRYSTLQSNYYQMETREMIVVPTGYVPLLGNQILRQIGELSEQKY